MPAGDSSVNLGGGGFNVPEQLLDGAEVGSPFEEMGRKRVPQSMRERPQPISHHSSDSSRIQWTAAHADPQCRVCLIPGESGTTFHHVASHRALCGSAYRNHSGLASLPDNPQHITVFHVPDL